uniref:Uncharacterized protein n=1 Tax=Tanacetum cinerariifolium TaxID=118510 RepID=A0A6L2P3X7_TANCI|nr:hypothetical protein [Tanacetum cinerariifolium]
MLEKDSSDLTKSSSLVIISSTVFGTLSEYRLASFGHLWASTNDDIYMTSGTPVIKPVSTIHHSLKVTRVSLAFLTILVIYVGSLKHALLVESLVVNCRLSSVHPSTLPCERVHRGRESTEMIFGSVVPSYNLMLDGILNSGPANSIIIRVKRVLTASLKGLFRSASPTSTPVTTVWILGRKVPFDLFPGGRSGSRTQGFDVDFERLPEVDPMMPTSVDPMLSPRVPLKPTVILMLRVSDAILRTQSREFRRRAPVSLSEDLPEILSRCLFRTPPSSIIILTIRPLISCSVTHLGLDSFKR